MRELLPRIPIPFQTSVQTSPSAPRSTTKQEKVPSPRSPSPAARVERTYESASPPLVTKLFVPLRRYPSPSVAASVSGM